MAPILRRLTSLYRGKRRSAQSSTERAEGNRSGSAGESEADRRARLAAGLEALRDADGLRDSGQQSAAADAYRRALDLLPDRNDIRVQLGNMLKDCGRVGEAETVYREAIAVSPGDGDIHLQLGRALKLAGRRDDAIAVLRRAVEVAPDLTAAADELGRLLPIGEDFDANGRVRSSIAYDGEGYLSGWVLDTDRVHEPAHIVVKIDGVTYQTLRASLDRGDLRRIAPDVVGGGFEVRLPPGRGQAVVSVLHDDRNLRGSPLTVTLQPAARRSGVIALSAAASPPAMAASPVAIIVPVYNAARSVAACLDAILWHTSLPAKLIVIDDASPDPDVAQVLRAVCGGTGVHVERNGENLGYTRTVNKSIDLAGGADVVLLNSDTLVGPRWLENLRTAAYSRPEIASVTAISDNAGAFSVPEMNAPQPLPDGFRAEDYQRLVMQTSGSYWPEVPTGNGFCIYLRRDAIEVIGTFDEQAFPRGYGEENDWCLRALRAGRRHLVDDRTLVLHERSASFGAAKGELMAAGRRVIDERYPEYGTLIASFHTSPGLCAARHRVRSLHASLDPSARPLTAEAVVGRSVRPRVLFVISTESGGTPLTNRDLMVTLSDRYEPWLLTCDSRSMSLFRVGAGPHGEDELIERAVLASPITLVEHRSADYETTLARWLVERAIELVHVRHLAWHSLELPAVAKGLGIPVALSFHDFYAVCPTVKLLDERQIYCAGRCTSSEGDCTPDLWRMSVRPPLKNRWIKEWRRRQAEVLEACDAFVTTSASARDTLIDAYPILLTRRFDVIPHGRDFTEWIAPAPPPSARLEQIDILVPGNISPAKGRDLIAKLHDMDADGRLRFHILGDCNPELKGERIVNHGTYKRDEFATHAIRTGAKVGAVLSIWSETYCHTLTEMWAIGLPVIGFDFGAVAERIRASGAGWIVPHEDVDQLYAALCGIADAPEEIARKSAAVGQWQDGEGRSNSRRAMAGRYDEIYRAILASRRTFAGLVENVPMEAEG